MGIGCLLPLDPQRDFCLVQTIGGSEMLVGTVMMSGEKFMHYEKLEFENQF